MSEYATQGGHNVIRISSCSWQRNEKRERRCQLQSHTQLSSVSVRPNLSLAPAPFVMIHAGTAYRHLFVSKNVLICTCHKRFSTTRTNLAEALPRHRLSVYGGILWKRYRFWAGSERERGGYGWWEWWVDRVRRCGSSMNRQVRDKGLKWGWRKQLGNSFQWKVRWLSWRRVIWDLYVGFSKENYSNRVWSERWIGAGNDASCGGIKIRTDTAEMSNRSMV